VHLAALAGCTSQNDPDKGRLESSLIEGDRTVAVEVAAVGSRPRPPSNRRATPPAPRPRPNSTQDQHRCIHEGEPPAVERWMMRGGVSNPGEQFQEVTDNHVAPINCPHAAADRFAARPVRACRSEVGSLLRGRN